MIVEGRVDFVSVSRKTDGITKIAFDRCLLNKQVTHLVALDTFQTDGAGTFG